MGRISYLITITDQKPKITKNNTLEVLFKDINPTSISNFSEY